MDEYKQFVYQRDPATYDNLDAGDLTRQRAVRERLQCKSFDWYMKEVAPDFLVKFPPVDPPAYASGAVESVAFKNYCLDCMNLGSNHPVGMFACAQNRTHPQENQNWALTAHRELRRLNEACLDVQDSHPNATVWMWDCHNQGGNQFWYYDRTHQWLVHGLHGSNCLEAFLENGVAKVVTNKCSESNERQRWSFGQVNNDLLDHFFDGLQK